MRTQPAPIAAATGIVGLALITGLLSGCSLTGKYSAETCDGRKPVSSLEQAGKELVVAAYAGDRTGVCRVTSPFPGGNLDDQMVSQTRQILENHGITPENVSVVVGEQFGSAVSVHLTDGSQYARHSLWVGGHSIREEGFTIGLPEELYPAAPEHPASQSSTVDP